MDEPLVEAELADSEPQRRSGPWKLIAIVAIVTLIGVWLVPGEGPEAPTGDAPTAAKAPSLLESPKQEPGLAETTLDGDPSVDLEPTAAGGRIGGPGSRARSLIARMRTGGAVDLAGIYDAARQAQADGEPADAYLLYFFAAREGHVPAALTLALQADPASRDPADSVFDSPDLTQANKWYQMAAQAGDREAAERLAALRARVEQMAADGDVQAQRIALLWE